jgi:putative endonuclease
MLATSTRAVGASAERRVVEQLVQSGHRLLAQNYACRWGELDLVIEKDDIVCFVEVRMRSTRTWGDPLDTISHAKQRRIVKTALFFLGEHRLWRKMIRFDVVSVVGSGDSARIEHIPNAFDAGM